MSLNLVNNYIFQQLFLVNPKKGEQSSFSLSRMQLQTRNFSRCIFQLQSKTIHTHTPATSVMDSRLERAYFWVNPQVLEQPFLSLGQGDPHDHQVW